MSKFQFTLTGETALLMHADDVEQSDELKVWQTDPQNKSVSVKGDDRSPAWTWQTYLYTDGERLTIPGDNIMVALRNAGAKMPYKGQETFKKLSQSGLVIVEEFCPFEGQSGPIDFSAIVKLRDLPFSEQAQKVKSLGFTLFTKRAKPEGAKGKHVRVRPRFDVWTVRGTIDVIDSAITPEILKQMFAIAGARSGLCDWRPSAPKSPGPFGRFGAKVGACK